MEIKPQRVYEKGAQLISVVCRIFDGEGVEHLHVGLVTNPTKWAEEIRYSVDNPPVFGDPEMKEI